MAMLTGGRARAATCCAWAVVLALGGGCKVEVTEVDDPALATQAADAASEPQESPPVSHAPLVSADEEPDDAVELPPIDSLPWPDDAPRLAKALYVGTWSVKPPEGFDRAWIDEAGLVETYSKRAAGRRQWSGLSASGDVLRVNDLLRDREGPAMAYAYTLVQRFGIPGLAPEAAWPDVDAVLHLRHRGRVRAWFDGEVVIDVEATEDGSWQHVRAPVTLTRGFDVLLLKLGRGGELGPSFDVEVCLTARDGSPVERQSWNTMRPSGFLDDRVPVEDG